jgi:hypothetical protein
VKLVLQNIARQATRTEIYIAKLTRLNYIFSHEWPWRSGLEVCLIYTLIGYNFVIFEWIVFIHSHSNYMDKTFK